jgi:hypothetical protein
VLDQMDFAPRLAPAIRTMPTSHFTSADDGVGALSTP